MADRTRKYVSLIVMIVASLDAVAQPMEQKLLAAHMLNATDLKELAAFDTLSFAYWPVAEVDTTSVISDSLWMSLVWIDDVDSLMNDSGKWYRPSCVCAHLYLMTYSPVLDRVLGLREVRRDCYAVDHYNTTMDCQYVASPNSVRVVTYRARHHQFNKDGTHSSELVPFKMRTFQVGNEGDIRDLGTKRSKEHGGECDR